MSVLSTTAVQLKLVQLQYTVAVLVQHCENTANNTANCENTANNTADCTNTKTKCRQVVRWVLRA